ncbi:MAG: ABC transporter substrate-binding protein [Desulfobacterales bacterium]|nr:ABC transporter substrate-binding protein [Desulfobacterales bacterium]MBF0396537.1 ABC transporter substrate-binding protein [Desulfobacterales bacterium]
MGKKFFQLIILILIIFCFNLYALAEEGLTDTEIHIAQFGPMSGPAIAWGSVVKGGDLAFKIINDEGGINGRKIVYHMVDDGYIPAKTKFGVKQMQETTGVFAWIGGVGTATALSVKDYISNKSVPWISPLSGAKEWIDPPNKYIFAMYPLLSMEARTLCNYAVKTMNKTKIAMVYQNDGYGKSGLAGAEEEMAKLNIQLVAKVAVEPTASELSPAALELKKVEADTVLIWLTPFAGLKLLQAAKTMKYEPQWMGGVSFADFPLMFKLSKGMWKDMICTNYADYNAPQVAKYKEAFKKYAQPDETWSTFYQVGIAVVEVLAEALKNAGKDLTREKLIAELEKLNNFKGSGGPIGFKPFNASDSSCRKGTNSVNIVQCLDGGETKQLTDYIKLE